MNKAWRRSRAAESVQNEQDEGVESWLSHLKYAFVQIFIISITHCWTYCLLFEASKFLGTSFVVILYLLIKCINEKLKLFDERLFGMSGLYEMHVATSRNLN